MYFLANFILSSRFTNYNTNLSFNLFNFIWCLVVIMIQLHMAAHWCAVVEWPCNITKVIIYPLIRQGGHFLFCICNYYGVVNIEGVPIQLPNMNTFPLPSLFTYIFIHLLLILLLITTLTIHPHPLAQKNNSATRVLRTWLWRP